MRIHAGYRLFSVPLTRITSVPECAVSSVGFLWGSVAVSSAVGFLWGSQEPLTYLADQIPGIQVLQLLHAVINLRVTQRGRDSLTRERWFRLLPIPVAARGRVHSR